MLVGFTLVTTNKPIFINPRFVAWVRPFSDSGIVGVGIELIDSNNKSHFPSFVVSESLEDVLARLNA